MLKSLHIKNFAIIDELNLEFGSGLNIITGETGSGKSIIFQGLDIILGARASSDSIKENENKAILEAKFYININNADIIKLINDNELDFNDNELIIRREISLKSNSRAFINDSPVNLSLIKEFGIYLADIHGQFEHQKIRNRELHLEIFDKAINSDFYLNNYQKVKLEFDILSKKLHQVIKAEKDAKQKQDFLEFAVKEIEDINPETNEDTQIEKDLDVLINIEKIRSECIDINNNLYDDEFASYSRLFDAKKRLNALAQFDTEFQKYADEMEALLSYIKELNYFLSSYITTESDEIDKIEMLNQRLSKLKFLVKKYGSIDATLDRLKKYKSELEAIVNFDKEKQDLQAKLKIVKQSLYDVAFELSNFRKGKVAEIDKKVMTELAALGIENAVFESQIHNIKQSSHYYTNSDNETVYFNDNGIDDFCFYFSANMGISPAPLNEIASGGEISRVMLALKSIVSKNETIGTLVFDEIDTGVSGSVARKVGKTMRKIAEYKQVLAITHLPQIASLSQTHISVEKKTIDGKTYTFARVLNEVEKIEEISKLISDGEVSESATNAAKELIK